jgi:hypothetical protein
MNAEPEPDADKQERALFVEARMMAARGWGWEDIYAKLKDRGLNRQEARIIVFGKCRTK